MNMRLDVSDWGSTELRQLRDFIDAWLESERPGCRLDVIGYDPTSGEVYAEDSNGVFTDADL